MVSVSRRRRRFVVLIAILIAVTLTAWFVSDG
jgi:cell division protein FtsB